MAKTRFIQTSFNSGVLSPLIKGRTDIDQYYKGLETGDNVVLIPQGGLKRRPGTEYIGTGAQKLNNITTDATTIMVNGGTVASIIDDDDSTTTTTTTNISTTDPYIVFQATFPSNNDIEFIDIRGISLTSLTSTEFKVQRKTAATSWIDVASLPLIGTEPQDFRYYVGQNVLEFRLVRIGTTDLGTDKVTLAGFDTYQATGVNSEVKLLDFSIESDRHYLLAFTDGNCRIFETAANTHVADIKTPYTQAQIADIRDTQSEQVMLLFHEDVAPQRIVNLGTDTEWAIDVPTFSNIPQYDYDDDLSPTPTSDVQVMTFTGFVAGDTFQIDIEGVLSKNITYAGDTSADEQTATAFNIQKNIQDMPVMGETGVAVARTGVGAHTITIGGESAKNFKLFSAFATSGTASKTVAVTKSVNGVARKEDVWSATRGYPKAACFYEGRLVLGGTKSKPQSLLISKAGSAFDFEIDEGDDDDAIFTTISSRKLNDIVDVFPGRNLQIFTRGSEFTVNVSPVTPSTIAITPQTSHGSLNVEAQEIDGATLFFDRNGKSLKEYLYSFNEDAYTTRDISVLSPELIKTPVDFAILGGTSSDDSNWVFIVNNDGSATVLNTLREQDINGFTSWTTTGEVKSTIVVDQDLYMIVKRTIAGGDKYFIERWSFDHLLDCSVKSTNTAPLDTVSGFSHLNGYTCRVVADGSVLDDRVVSGESITLTAEEEFHTNFEVGIGFTATFKGMPINTNIGSGQNALRIKKILRMNMRVISALGLYIEGEPVPSRSFGESILDTAPNQKTGIIEDVYNLAGWVRDEMPEFTCPDPTPFTVLNIEYEVESS